MRVEWAVKTEGGGVSSQKKLLTNGLVLMLGVDTRGAGGGARGGALQGSGCVGGGVELNLAGGG